MVQAKISNKFSVLWFRTVIAATIEILGLIRSATLYLNLLCKLPLSFFHVFDVGTVFNERKRKDNQAVFQVSIQF